MVSKMVGEMTEEEAIRNGWPSEKSTSSTFRFDNWKQERDAYRECIESNEGADPEIYPEEFRPAGYARAKE